MADTLAVLTAFFALMFMAWWGIVGVCRYERRKHLKPNVPREPRRLKVSAIAFVLLSVAAAEASACNRCGHFGTACRYHAAATYVAPVVAATPYAQNVYVIQNSYPAPLVAQGSSTVVSTGGFQALTLPQFDPTAFLSQSLELVKAGQTAATLAHAQAHTTAQRALELQAQALHTQTTVTSSVTTTAEAVNPPPSLLRQYCAKCHGLDLATPKGGLFLGDDAAVARTMEAKHWRIAHVVGTSKTMPPAEAPQPTDQERGAILNEIDAILTRRSGVVR